IAPAWTTRDDASGIVMKNRVISGFVTVTGPPRSICLRKIGITEPDEPSTLPKRTATNRVSTSGCNENDSIDAELDGDLRDRARRKHVVRHRLQRVRLEHADVLVRGRVEQNLRPVALEHLAHLGAVAAVCEHGDRGGEVSLVDELTLDLEERRLALVDQHDPRRTEPRQLAAELRADRAAGAGDEHGLVLHVG